MSRIDGALHVGGLLTADSMTLASSSVKTTSINDGAVTAAKIAQSTNSKIWIPWTDFFVHDAATTRISTPGNDDLGIVTGTFGTDGLSIQAGDLVTAGATTRYARFQVALPLEYDAGNTVQIRAQAGMVDNQADTSATLDFEAHLQDNETGVGSDLVTTAATDMNDTTFSALDFVVTAGSLNPGDVLDVRMAIAVNDGAGGSPVTACVGGVWLLCDTK